MRNHGETVYSAGNAVLVMALLVRLGGSVTLSRAELTEVDGTIYQFPDRDGAVTYRLEPNR